MKLKATIFVTVSICLIGTLLYSCGGNQAELKKVTVAQFGDVFLYMPLYIAQSEGFFEQEGLDVEITSTGGDDKTFSAVVSGSAMFGIADPTFVAIAKEKGQGGKVIASIVNGVPFWGITKNKNVPEINNNTQLRNYSVATFPAPSTAYTLQHKMFVDAGLKPNIRQAAFGTLLSLLESENVDIALELEPNVSTAIKNGARIVYSLSEKYGDFAITAVTTSDETIKNDPELVQHFVNAIHKAERFAHENPERAIESAKKKFPDIDGDIIQNAMERIIKSNTLPQNALVSSSSWNKAIDLRRSVGEIKSATSSDGILDMSFALEAIKNLK